MKKSELIMTNVANPLPSLIKNKINKLIIKKIKKRSLVAGKIAEFLLRDNLKHIK